MIWSDIDFNPSERKLRSFAGLFLVATATPAAWQICSHETSVLTALLLIASLLVGIGGYLEPRGVRRLYVAMMVVSFPMGWVTSHLVLAMVYFSLFTPLAVLFRWIGRDALRRRAEAGCSTYFEPKTAPSNKLAYFRPF